MPPAQLFYGRVLPGGLLVLDRPKDYNREVRSLAGKHIEIVIRKRKVQRTPQANRFYWGYVVPEIAEAAGYTKDEAHDALRQHFLTVHEGPLPKVRSTTDLSVEEFSDYLQNCMVLGAQQFGIVWMDRDKWEAA